MQRHLIVTWVCIYASCQFNVVVLREKNKIGKRQHVVLLFHHCVYFWTTPLSMSFSVYPLHSQLLHSLLNVTLSSLSTPVFLPLCWDLVEACTTCLNSSFLSQSIICLIYWLQSQVYNAFCSWYWWTMSYNKKKELTLLQLCCKLVLEQIYNNFLAKETKDTSSKLRQRKWDHDLFTTPPYEKYLLENEIHCQNKSTNSSHVSRVDKKERW